MRYIILVIFTLITFFNSSPELFSEEYKVDAGDILYITVYEQPDLAAKARVASSGDIAFPLLGSVDVKGLTIDEIQNKITHLLKKDYLVDPQLSVFIEEYRIEKVFVMGFVNKPGEYELFKDRPTTVLEAVTMAGGFKPGAAPNGTKIMRTEDGREVTIPVRANDITKRGDKGRDIIIKPGDIVVVPESFF